jgi:large subunit ribosomal protein L27
MSTHKAGGKASQHVSPAGKRLGPKVSDGEKVAKGEIIMRQRGTSFTKGVGVKEGRDHTIYSMLDGFVKYSKKMGKKVISVISK